MPKSWWSTIFVPNIFEYKAINAMPKSWKGQKFNEVEIFEILKHMMFTLNTRESDVSASANKTSGNVIVTDGKITNFNNLKK